jgi:hypothetical protein
MSPQHTESSGSTPEPRPVPSQWERFSMVVALRAARRRAHHRLVRGSHQSGQDVSADRPSVFTAPADGVAPMATLATTFWRSVT